MIHNESGSVCQYPHSLHQKCGLILRRVEIPPPPHPRQNCRRMANRGHAKFGMPPCGKFPAPLQGKKPPTLLLTTWTAMHKYQSYQTTAPVRPYYSAIRATVSNTESEVFTQWHGKMQKAAARSGRRPSPATAKNTPTGRPGSPRAAILGPASRSSGPLPARRSGKFGRRCRPPPWRSTRGRTPRPRG